MDYDRIAEFVEFVCQLSNLQKKAAELEFHEIEHLIGVAELAALDRIQGRFIPVSVTMQ
jgi:hypothetical protein